MDDNENLSVQLKARRKPLREDSGDGATVMTWHLRTAHPAESHLLTPVAEALSDGLISLSVDQVDGDAVVVSVRSNREIPYTAVWDFSIRSLLTIDQRCGELIAIEGTDRDEWRYQFVAAEHSGTFAKDKTALMVAAELGDLERLAAILTTTDANEIDERTPFGQSALSYAASKGHAEAVALLMRAGAQPLTDCEITTLQAGILGGVEVVRLLLAKGADVNGRNRYGETGLMSASALGKLEIVNELLSHGADPNLEDNTSHTAFDRARQIQQPEILEVLQRFSQSK